MLHIYEKIIFTLDFINIRIADNGMYFEYESNKFYVDGNGLRMEVLKHYRKRFQLHKKYYNIYDKVFSILFP